MKSKQTSQIYKKNNVTPNISNKLIINKLTTEKSLIGKSIPPKSITKSIKKEIQTPIPKKQESKRLDLNKQKSKNIFVKTDIKNSQFIEKKSQSNEPEKIKKLFNFNSTEFDETSDPGYFLNSEVYDEGEQAQFLHLKEMAEINFTARKLNAPEKHSSFDGKHCIDCDITIPQKRLELNKIRCVDCQLFLEEEKKRKQVTNINS